MRKQPILYKGDEIEALWSVLGYLGPMFIVSFYLDKKSIFLRIHSIRSAIIFFLSILINVPVAILHHTNITNIFSSLYTLIALISSIILFIIYCKSIHQAANGIYKKTLIDKIFGKYITKYLSCNL